MRKFHPAVALLLMAMLTIGCKSKTETPSPGKPVAEKSDDPAPTAETPPVDETPPTHAQDGIVTENHLADETSLYLLMHAENPVDWYPWGEAAFQKAKSEKKVIFLSIGYSSCHWCHVMEHESFVDKEIAAFLNKHFVCIKVDREERPDVDGIYMQSLQIFNQLTRNGRGGGWPLSMFLTPEGQPFFGGTYFPARDGDRGPSMGFLTTINRVEEAWRTDPEAIRGDAATITRFVKQATEGTLNELQTVDAAFPGVIFESLERQFDSEYGGFSFSADDPHRPKFPEPANLLFLIDRAQRGGDDSAKAVELLTTTLDHMAMGGIRDHLGGGFHRYSVDRFWHIPHFEKMLYDNGQLASVYAEAYALTKKPSYRQVIEEMMTFLKREMVSDDGAFLTALDADSEGEEGKFYRWTKEELERIIPDEDEELFFAVYRIDEEPNFEGEFYAPQLPQTLAEIAATRNTTEEALEQRLKPLRDKLFIVRSQRQRPLTDEKILTSWNGLMIRGLADSGRIFDRPDYVEMAVRAADFVLAELRTDEGRLQRTYGKGHAKLNAYLNDYAFLTYGLIGLHQATGEPRWLSAALEITDKQLELFWDESGKGFFFTSSDHESLLARAKNPHDGAQPSGNSIAAINLLYLAKATNEDSYRQYAKETVEAMAGLTKQFPAAAPLLGVAAADLAGEQE
jgi:hypothetical protein